jgi:hypothetical protein
MKQSIGALFVLALTTSMLVGCNGSSSPGPVPTGAPSGNCGNPPNSLEVIYPIPNTHKAPAALANIYVATKGSLPPSNSYDFYLTQSNGSSTFTGLFTPIAASNIPTPHAKPSFPNPSYYYSAIAGPYGSSYIIGPAQAVSLLWNDGGLNCTPHTLVASFRTRG